MLRLRQEKTEEVKKMEILKFLLFNGLRIIIALFICYYLTLFLSNKLYYYYKKNKINSIFDFFK